MMQIEQKAVITGLGAICSLGQNCDQILDNLKQGIVGIRKVNTLNLSRLSTQVGGEVESYPHNFPEEIKDRASELAYLAMMEAIQDAGLDFKIEDPYRCAISYGTCNGNMLTMEALYEQPSQLEINNLAKIYQQHYAVIDQVNKLFNFRGPKAIFITACSASNQAIGYAYDLITLTQADIVVVGGADSFAKTTFAGFHSLQSLSSSPCSPFSNRFGISLGEGSGFMIVESEFHAKQRKAKIYAEILGYGFNGDAYHATSPDITGDGAFRTITSAVRTAMIDPKKIEVVCAHGTGTEANDKTETKAIRTFFKDHAPELFITSMKSSHGHTLGAAGILQAIMMIKAMNHHFIPPILNFDQPREGCDLTYVKNKPMERKFSCFISNSFAFGGNNVSVIFAKGGAYNKNGNIREQSEADKKVVITGAGYITPLFREEATLLKLIEDNIPCRENQLIRFEKFVLSNPDFKRFKKCPLITQLTIESIELALKDADYRIDDGTKIGLIWGVGKGAMKTFEKYYLGLLRDGIEFASAIYFPHIVLNAVAGQASIAFGIKGCNTAVAGSFSPFLAMNYASQLIKQGKNDIFIIGGSDEISMFDEKMIKEPDFNDFVFSEGAASLIFESEEHAKKRQAKIYAEVEGFSITSSWYNDLSGESYKTALEQTLKKANLSEDEIDLHIPCLFGNNHLASIIYQKNIKLANSQVIAGTLESSTAVLNTIFGLLAIKKGLAPNYHISNNKVYNQEFKHILISGIAMNGNCYSFILKKPDKVKYCGYCRLG